MELKITTEKLEKNLGQGFDPKKELTPEEKEIARSLETLPSLDIRAEIDLILVWRNLKSASQLFFPAGTTDANMVKIKERIEKAGLFFIDDGVILDKMYGNGLVRLCFIANNEKDLYLFAELWFGDHIADSLVYKEIGRMSGFPQSAIDTYDKFIMLSGKERDAAKEELTLSENEKKDLFPADLYRLSLFFYMSRAHWQTELETVRTWVEELKRVTPSLYQRFIEEL